MTNQDKEAQRDAFRERRAADKRDGERLAAARQSLHELAKHDNEVGQLALVLLSIDARLSEVEGLDENFVFKMHNKLKRLGYSREL